MSDTTEHYRPGVLHRIAPAGDGAPLVFDIPRSGHDYPNDFRSPAGFNEVKSSISMYVNELFDQAPMHGATWLYACFPNAYIDANRHESDIDPALIDGTLDTTFEPTEKSEFGVGLIHRVCDGTGAPLQQLPISTRDLRRRLEEFYWPYHNELSSTLQDMRARSGCAFHVSCHSMASIARGVSKDAGAPRSDFDIGDRHSTTCEQEFVDTVREFLSGLGYDVTVNKHFAGAECIRKHTDMANGIQSLQIETRRGLYMDEETYEKRPEFETVRAHLGQLAAHLANFSRTFC
ncbi:MAG: N-formylglutamate amidohydrolase [Rhodospirillaceae bacterium]|nr:N-formylglutamate amidohydrolase [Rhodospirillaceae bacterium]MDD9924764.1 N-formylglutamate amidohydrolase [Rhodospirillaceae bacterium]